jgi:regulatory protein
MTNENHLKALFQKAAIYCSRSEKCRDDVRTFLKKYTNIVSEIEITINELEKENFLNTERYVKAFVNDKYKISKWGKLKIEFALKQKNISTELIKEQLNCIETSDYLDNLRSVIKNKSAQIREKDTNKRKASIIRFALSRGFDYGSILKILESEKE